MTANASDYADTTTRDDLERRADALLGWAIEHLISDNAHRYGRDLRTLSTAQWNALYEDIAPRLFGRVCADTEEVERWIEIARRAER